MDNERKDVLISNLISAYRAEMGEEELKKFLMLEIGFTKEECEHYCKLDSFY